MIRLLRCRPGTWLRNGGKVLGWMLLRASAQVATLLLLTRLLGASDYGRLVVVISLAAFITPLVGLGLSNVLLRNGARDPANLPIYLGIAARWWWRTLLPGLGLGLVLFLWLLPEGLPLLAGVAAIGAEVAASSLADLRARHRQAEHRIGAFGAINSGLPLLRLAMLAMLFLVLPDAGTESVLWVYTASSMFYMPFLLGALQGLPRNGTGTEPMPASGGLPFTVAIVAVRLQSEFNKPILAHSAFWMAGTYNVAQRFVELASMPLLALQEALWPRLYADSHPTQALLRTGTWLLSLALACSAVLYVVAPVLPRLLGGDYAASVDVLRMLAWLPLLQTLRALLNVHVIHHRRMQWIGLGYACGALVGVATLALLVPHLGLHGAVVAAYASEVAMIAFLIAGTRSAEA